MNDVTCLAPGCDRQPHAKGLCEAHYRRKSLPLDSPVKSLNVGTPDERFWRLVDGTGDCWEWQGRRQYGYGIITIGRREVKAHRFAYESLVGRIPDGLVIDHLCKNRACVNPDHLEVVTLAENTRRGVGAVRAGLKARAVTHCARAGHEFSPENTYVDKRGYRACIACRRAASARAYRRKQSAA